MKKLLITVCLGMMMFFSAPQQAFAYVLDVVNPYSDTMSVALLDFDDSTGTWRTHGWWLVTPNSTRTLEFKSSTKANHVYIYAKTSEASFGGDGYPASIRRSVIGDVFTYHDGESCPPGKNPQKVYFAKNELVDGYLEWRP